MTSRDMEWLASHNLKRRIWHARYNKSFVPLSWDKSLKAESKVWAEHLLSSCGKAMWHDPNNQFGENVASNSGTGSWASVRTTDDIVARFVDREEGKEFPENLHLTQVRTLDRFVLFCGMMFVVSHLRDPRDYARKVLWRSTHHVGCAEASKALENGGVCHTQVCRYARPGEKLVSLFHRPIIVWYLTIVVLHSLLVYFSRQLQHE